MATKQEEPKSRLQKEFEKQEEEKSTVKRKRGRPKTKKSENDEPYRADIRPITALHKRKDDRERAEILKDIDDMVNLGTTEWHGFDETEINIDREQFEKLCSMLCTAEEIASFFYCTVVTLSKWCKRTYGVNFSEAYARFSLRGHISLRRILFHHAARNPVMAIFLSKNYLGLKDVPDDNSQQEILEHLDEIKNALMEAAKKPVIDLDTGMVYDAQYADEHSEDTNALGHVVEVDENAD